MDSKTFFNEYLERESDDTILNMNYVIVSTRIRVHEKYDNIALLHQLFFPKNYVYDFDDEDMMEARYFEQLNEEGADGFLAVLILSVINDGAGYVFLTTKKEMRLPYLKWIQEYIMYVFEFPLYDYKVFNETGIVDEYDKKRVKKICKKILKETQRKKLDLMARSEKGKAELMKKFKKDKKFLIKELKKRGLYSKKLSKYDMLELMEEFM